MSKPVWRARLALFLAAIFNSANARDDRIPILIQPPSVVMRSLCFPRPYAGVGILLNGDDYRKFAPLPGDSHLQGVSEFAVFWRW